MSIKSIKQWDQYRREKRLDTKYFSVFHSTMADEMEQFNERHGAIIEEIMLDAAFWFSLVSQLPTLTEHPIVDPTRVCMELQALPRLNWTPGSTEKQFFTMIGLYGDDDDTPAVCGPTLETIEETFLGLHHDLRAWLTAKLEPGLTSETPWVRAENDGGR